MKEEKRKRVKKKLRESNVREREVEREGGQGRRTVLDIILKERINVCFTYSTKSSEDSRSFNL